LPSATASTLTLRGSAFAIAPRACVDQELPVSQLFELLKFFLKLFPFFLERHHSLVSHVDIESCDRLEYFSLA